MYKNRDKVKPISIMPPLSRGLGDYSSNVQVNIEKIKDSVSHLDSSNVSVYNSNVVLHNIDLTLDNIDGKITKGNSATTAGAEMQQVLMYGKKPDNTLQPLETSGDRLLVDVLELAASGQITTSTALSSVQVCGYDTLTSRFKTMNVDSSGNIQCDIVSGTVNATVSSAVIKGNDGNDGSGTDRIIKTDGNGALIVDPSKEGIITSDGTTTALHTMMLGNYSGNLRTLQCDSNGVLSVDSSTLATEATLSLAEGHLINVDTNTAGILDSHYSDGDTISATDTGILIMGRNGTNSAKPIHITNNGDVEVEIADFVKGQATKANSFPVVLASDTDTISVEQSYSYSSEHTIFNAVSIADGANSTSSSFEVQSVKVEDPNITLTVDSGGSTNYDLQFEGSHDNTNFFPIGFSTSLFNTQEMTSTRNMAVYPPRYLKLKISNNNGSGGPHTFTVKAQILGATIA